MFLDYFALIIMIVVFLILVYAAIYIHDIPYEMAKKRNHPHQDAIHVGGWLSLFTLHAIWPFLWIWATLYKPETGYGFSSGSAGTTVSDTELNELKKNISALQERLATLEGQSEQERQQ
jgi:hypothetical protein